MPKEIDRRGLQQMVEAGAKLVEVLPAEEYAEEHFWSDQPAAETARL